MAFDVEGARKSGYSDAEIAQYLSGEHKFDYQGATSAGYAPSEIISHLLGDDATTATKPSMYQNVYDAFTMETGRPETPDVAPAKHIIPTISALTPELQAKSRSLTNQEQKYLTTQKNIELAQKYPKNYYTGVSGQMESFGKGLLPTSKEAPPDIEQAYPITHAAGQLAGLAGTALLTRGIAPAVTTAKMISTLPTIARMAAGKMAQTGATFGIKEFMDNMAEMYAGKDKSAGEVLKNTLTSTASGGVLGLAGTPASPFMRIPAEMGYGYLDAKIRGADNFHAGLNAGLFGLFGLLNTKNLSNAYKMEAYNGSKRALVDRLVEKGADESQASRIADRYFQYAINKTGGWKNSTTRDFDTFSKAMKKGWDIAKEDVSDTGLIGGVPPTEPPPIWPAQPPPPTAPTKYKADITNKPVWDNQSKKWVKPKGVMPSAEEETSKVSEDANANAEKRLLGKAETPAVESVPPVAAESGLKTPVSKEVKPVKLQEHRQINDIEKDIHKLENTMPWEDVKLASDITVNEEVRKAFPKTETITSDNPNINKIIKLWEEKRTAVGYHANQMITTIKNEIKEPKIDVVLKEIGFTPPNIETAVHTWGGQTNHNIERIYNTLKTDKDSYVNFEWGGTPDNPELKWESIEQGLNPINNDAISKTEKIYNNIASKIGYSPIKLQEATHGKENLTGIQGSIGKGEESGRAIQEQRGGGGEVKGSGVLQTQEAGDTGKEVKQPWMMTKARHYNRLSEQWGYRYGMSDEDYVRYTQLRYKKKLTKQEGNDWKRIQTKIIDNAKTIDLEHKQSVQQALSAGKLTPEQYKSLHEKDYGKLEGFMPELRKPAETTAPIKIQKSVSPEESTDWKNESIANKAKIVGLNDKVVNHPLFNQLKGLVDKAGKRLHGKNYEFNKDADWQWSYLDYYHEKENSPITSLQKKIAKDVGVELHQNKRFKAWDLGIPEPTKFAGEQKPETETQQGLFNKPEVPAEPNKITEMYAGFPINKVIAEISKSTAPITHDLHKMFSPPTVTTSAELAAGIIRERNARLAQRMGQIYKKLDAFRGQFNKMPEKDQIAYINAYETGQAKDNFSQFAYKTLTDNWREVQTRKGTDRFIEDYWPHFWEKGKAGIWQRVFGKKPLQGPATFLKKRTIPTLQDGINAGLKPVTTNPVDMLFLKIGEMQRFVMGHDIWQEYKDKGFAKFVKFGTKSPDGYVKINDKLARVLQYSEAEKGFVIRGEYFAPEPVARILNNFLSPGLRGNALYDTFRYIGNTMNQVQLGLSAYHLTFTSLDSIISKYSLGLQELGRGQFGKSIQHLSPHNLITTPITNYLQGNKISKEYYLTNPSGTEISKIVDAGLKGGFRVKMDNYYKNSSVESFWNAIHQGKYGSAGVKSISAALEYMAKPLMEHIVPRQKLGVFADMAKSQMDLWEKQGHVPTIEEQRAVYGKLWDSVDNRMGQLVYDNLFWNKILKDIGMLTTRSLGWNLGSIRELTGGVKDIKDIKVGKQGIILSPRTAYLLALPAITAIYGGITYYLYNGKLPDDIKDYYFPKNDKGERVTLPTYMKDIFAYKEHPLLTVGHKVHPMISAIIDMINNKDFYNVEIRNPDDSLVKQTQQEFEYIAKQFVPFSVRNLQQRMQAGGGVAEGVESFFGLVPAPSYVDRSPAEKIMYDYMSRKMPQVITQEERQRSQATRDIEKSMRQGIDLTPEQQQQLNELGRREKRYITQKSKMSSFQNRFKQLNTETAIKTWNVATPEEKDSVKHIYNDKIGRAKRNNPAETNRFLSR